MRHYSCINCGTVGDFGFDRTRRIECGHCAYDSILEIDREDYEGSAEARKLGSPEFEAHERWCRRVRKSGTESRKATVTKNVTSV